MIAKTLYKEITTSYGPFKELLTDNGRNLISKVIQVYIALLKAKYRVITPYYPRTNRKVENLNGIIDAILIKILINQPTIL